MRAKKIIKLLIIFFIVFWISAALSAAGDVLVGFRLYKGIKGNETREEKPSVVTSYHLRPLFVGNLVTETGMKEEKEELKGIFNLADLELMTRSQWAWQENDKEKRHKLIILNGHEFIVTIGLKNKKDIFDVEVVEKAKTGTIELLGTEIVLPETKTGVFGFEDSLKKPYFLSFHRESDKSVIREDMAMSQLEKPRLISRVSPDYPKVAKRAEVEGNVILEASTDIEGNVVDLKVLKGNPLLRKAAIKAVKQWKYEPFRVRGKVQPAVFTVNVYFRLNQPKGEKAGELSARKIVREEDEKDVSIPNIWPTMGYLTDTFGKRKHPITGKVGFHYGIDIAARKGTEVVSAAAGVVILAESRKDEGNLIIIDHRNGYTTRYGRLDAFKVKKGDTVKKGEVIGYVGSTGMSTAPHLHWEVRLNGEPVNPMTLLTDE